MVSDYSSFVGDTTGFKRDKKPVVYCRYPPVLLFSPE
jgi:hypothetical protein